MSKRPWLLALVVALGLVAVEACSDSDTPPSASAGSAGQTESPGGHSGVAGHSGSGAVVAGATNENAGQAGEGTNDAGTAGAAGSSDAGATNGGSAGTSTGGSAGVGGTLSSGGGAGVGGAGNTFTLQSTTLGQVIGTASGLTLYVFNTDTPAIGAAAPVSTCISTGCQATWPLYHGTPISVPPGLLASDFGSFERDGGVLQSTYKGSPLYSYATDAAPGDVKGEGIGNKWYSVKLPFTSPGATTFTLQTTTLGKVIATAGGLSLYVFTMDTPGTGTTAPVTTCTGGCLGAWPSYHGTPISVPLGLLASDFGSYDRGAGVLQSTYKGWPLYTYATDAAPGDVLGEGVNGKWYTAKSPFVLPL